ncbi:hypothetical protein IU11_15015 [Cellulosimicrobium sp. MM]|nr:hypothetical protein IU11_15015 [Cellulosimicrobium sp. MM]
MEVAVREHALGERGERDDAEPFVARDVEHGGPRLVVRVGRLDPPVEHGVGDLRDDELDPDVGRDPQGLARRRAEYDEMPA